MKFNWEDYLKLGEKLIREEGELKEARYRSGISRIYYCVYHQVLEFLRRIGVDLDDRNLRKEIKEKIKLYKREQREPGNHETLIELFKSKIIKDYSSIDEKKAVWIGVVLDGLKLRRIVADYYDEFKHSKLKSIDEEAIYVLREAEDLLKEITNNA